MITNTTIIHGKVKILRGCAPSKYTGSNPMPVLNRSLKSCLVFELHIFHLIEKNGTLTKICSFFHDSLNGPLWIDLLFPNRPA